MIVCRVRLLYTRVFCAAGQAGVCLAAMLMAWGAPAPPGAVNFRSGPGFHATTPSGYNIIQLKPSGSTVELLALVECPEIEGMRQMSEGLNAIVVSPGGVPLKHFPHHFNFRVTATLRKLIPEPPDQFVNSGQDPQQFLLSLQFRLKVYDGLQMHQVAPTSVKQIGVPGDVPYDERVFRVRFDLDDLPVTDRVVLETLSPQGDCLSHFPFGML